MITWCSRGQSVHDACCSVAFFVLSWRHLKPSITQYLNKPFPRNFKFSAIDNRKSPWQKWILCMVLNLVCLCNKCTCIFQIPSMISRKSNHLSVYHIVLLNKFTSKSHILELKNIFILSILCCVNITVAELLWNIQLWIKIHVDMSWG